MKHFKRKSVSLKAFATVDILQIEWPHNWQEGNGRRTVLPTMANIHGSKVEIEQFLENSLHLHTWYMYKTTTLKYQIDGNKFGNTEEKGEGTQIGSSIGFSE